MTNLENNMNLPTYIKEKRAEFDSKFFAETYGDLRTSERDAIPVFLESVLTQLVEKMEEELAGDLEHPEFCRVRGEQYKECAKCYVSRRIQLFKTGEITN